MTKKLVVSASLLAKSQVATYTRKDGVTVQAHDNGKQPGATAAAGKKGVGKKPHRLPLFSTTNPLLLI